MMLMHGDIPVAVLSDTLTVEKMINPCNLPAGVLQNAPTLTNARLLQWFGKRTIPNNRMFSEKIQKKTGCSFQEAMLRARSVSLTDTYWLKNPGDDVTWKMVNYYDKPFDNKIMPALVTDVPLLITDFRHPTFTTDGVLEKTWILLDDIPYLIKFDETSQQLIGEVFASRVADMMHIPHVPYSPIRIQGRDAVICPCLIDNPYTDMIFAMQYAWSIRATGMGLFEHLSEVDAAGIHKMLALDYLTRQEDRHAYNFAFADGKMLPIYDSGRCLSVTETAKPFVRTRDEILQIMDMGALQKLPSLNSILLTYKESCEAFHKKTDREKESLLVKSYEKLLLEREKFYDGTDLERG